MSCQHDYLQILKDMAAQNMTKESLNDLEMSAGNPLQYLNEYMISMGRKLADWYLAHLKNSWKFVPKGPKTRHPTLYFDGFKVEDLK